MQLNKSPNLIDKKLTLEPDEEFILQKRRSKSILLIPLFLSGVFIFIPFFFLFFLFHLGELGILMFFSSILVGVLIGLNSIIRWKFTGLIITDHRVIDYDQSSLFKRTVSNIPIQKIREVFYEIQGFGQVITKTGTITIIISDSQTKFRLRDITNPQSLQNEILRLSKGLNFNSKDISPL